jgi:hypothetical protein
MYSVGGFFEGVYKSVGDGPTTSAMCAPGKHLATLISASLKTSGGGRKEGTRRKRHSGYEIITFETLVTPMVLLCNPKDRGR